jgi:hypothetical protein
MLYLSKSKWFGSVNKLTVYQVRSRLICLIGRLIGLEPFEFKNWFHFEFGRFLVVSTDLLRLIGYRPRSVFPRHPVL